MPSVRRATPPDALVIARHRFPDLKAGDEVLGVYAEWAARAIVRGVYVGFLAVQDDVVVAGAGLTLLEWGPTRHDPSPLVTRLVKASLGVSFGREGPLWAGQAGRRLGLRVSNEVQETHHAGVYPA